jgi:DNA-binding HxlR family transcriptional regulator
VENSRTSSGEISPARVEALAALTHHSWAIPVLATFAAAPPEGLKHATLLHRLSIGRGSLGRTLAAVVAQGWVRSNPGIGHALRPEYTLTDAGRRIGPACLLVVKEIDRLKLGNVGSHKWTLPILASIVGGVRRFGDVRRLAASATPRAISLCLREMEDAGLVLRQVQDTYPPVPEYSLTRRALRLSAAVRRLVLEIGLRPTPQRQQPLDRRHMKAG